MKELKDFWNELESKSEVKLKDIEKLKNLLGKVFLKVQELEKSRNNWRDKYKEK